MANETSKKIFRRGIYAIIQEIGFRYEIFRKNYEFVKEHSERYAKGLEQFDVEINKFADLSQKEFKEMYTGLKRKSSQVTTECKGKIDMVDDPPKEMSWKNKAVSPIKNQGACGSYWAFSACGSLEGLYAIKQGKIESFSPQQMVDCAGK